MPLTPFQQEVLAVLAFHRQPGSHVAGGIVINRSSASPRYSADIDFFHDAAESVPPSSDADAAALVKEGYAVEWLLRQPSAQRATAKRGTEELKLEWCHDSAFRFFPIQHDPEFGYCLHSADLAANKALALAGRAEIRDFIDILYLHETYLTLGAICWAACGKDEGFTPWSLLDFAKRHMKFRAEDLAGEHLAHPIGLPALKDAWLKAVVQAEELFARLPPTEIGCLYLPPSFSPLTPDPGDPAFPTLVRHFGSVGGAWPTID